MKIVYQPIGTVHSPFTEPDGMPIQPARGRGVQASVEILPELADGLQDLDGFSHIILVCHLHRSAGFSLRVVPFLDDVPRGLFATRAPRRPNPIGLSVVRLLAIEDNRIEFEGVDLLDGTPVLDIKPYMPELDDREETRFGWLEKARRRAAVSDGRFTRDDDGSGNA